MTLTLFIVGTAAVWRVTTLIAGDEEGPFGLFSAIRGRIDPYQRTWLGRGVRCPWCVSFWLGWGLAAYVWGVGVLPLWTVPVAALAWSGGAIVVEIGVELCLQTNGR